MILKVWFLPLNQVINRILKTSQFQFSIFVAGFLGNFLCVVCFSLKKGKRNFHYLMMSLAVFDILYIYCATMLFTIPHLLPRLVLQTVVSRNKVAAFQILFNFSNQSLNQLSSNINLVGKYHCIVYYSRGYIMTIRIQYCFQISRADRVQADDSNHTSTS